MLHTIDPHISDYIDIAIERERKLFRADLDENNRIIKADTKYEISLALEVFQSN